MLKTVINEVISALRECGADHVYSEFDAVSTELKGRNIITVVGVGGLECSAPILSAYNIYLPFKTTVTVSLTAPLSANASMLFDCFDAYAAPAFSRLPTLTAALRGFALRKDNNLGRLVLRAEYSVSGISKTERSFS